MEVSADLVSTVTDSVLKEVKEWQSRPLEALYPIVYFDAVRMKVRAEGQMMNKAAYLAIGVVLDVLKDALGIWLEKTEGAKFWLKVITKLQNRGPEAATADRIKKP